MEYTFNKQAGNMTGFEAPHLSVKYDGAGTVLGFLSQLSMAQIVIYVLSFTLLAYIVHERV